MYGGKGLRSRPSLRNARRRLRGLPSGVKPRSPASRVRQPLVTPKAALAGDCFGGAKIPRPEVATEYETARVIGQLEAAQDLHQIVNLAPGGGPARFMVLLHTQTSIESQDHTG